MHVCDENRKWSRPVINATMIVISRPEAEGDSEKWTIKMSEKGTKLNGESSHFDQ